MADRHQRRRSPPAADGMAEDRRQRRSWSRRPLIQGGRQRWGYCADGSHAKLRARESKLCAGGSHHASTISSEPLAAIEFASGFDGCIC
eukprot:5047242-Amphidinium_carterae.1